MNVRSDAGQSLVATFVTLGLAYGVWYAYSVFLVVLAEELHWSRSLVAGAFAVFALVHGLFAGTDRNTAPMQLLYVVTGGSVMAMTVLRSVSILRKRAAPAPAERPARKPGTTQQA